MPINNRSIFVLLSGAISGIICLGIEPLVKVFDEYPGFYWYLLPPIVYGIVTSIIFKITGRVKGRYGVIFFWTTISFVSYIVAMIITASTSSEGYHSLNIGPINFALGGIIGAVIITSVFSSTYNKIPKINFALIIAIGGAVAYLIAILFGPIEEDVIPMLHFPWQTIVTLVLVMSAQESTEKVKI